MIYLDYNATTPLDPRVGEALQPYLADRFGNPSSLHQFGRTMRTAMDEARRALATSIHAQPDELVFTSGATEANNLALRGLAEARRARGRQLITTTIEHPSVLGVCAALERDGFQVTHVPADATGRVTVDAIAEAITSETTVIAVMAANNEVGTMQPVGAIGALARARGIAFHVDAAQAWGRMPVDVEAWQADTLTLSAHKAYGPKGVGALYVRRGVELAPVLVGGHQEAGRRPGTENVPAIVGFGCAATLMRGQLAEDVARMQRLRDHLLTGVQDRIEDTVLNGHPTERLCNTVNVRFADVSGEALVMRLDLEGLAVSTGAACSSGRREPSHVLLAMGRSVEEAKQCVRFSLGRFTTEEEIQAVITVVERVVPALRTITVAHAARG